VARLVFAAKDADAEVLIVRASVSIRRGSSAPPF